MKVLVLGAGKMSSAITLDLMKNKVEVAVGDIDFEAAEKVARKYDAIAIKVDVKAHDKLIKLMKKYDAVVSAVPYFLNYKPVKAAIKASTNFCDLGGNTEIVKKELKLHDSAKRAGITVIPDCGLAPGITNILSGLGARKVKNLYAIYCRVGGLPQAPKPPLNYGLFFSIEGLINEYTRKCRIIRNGKIKEVEPLTEIEDVVLLRVSVVGEKEKIEYELVDYFDKKNKLSAMARTTGFSASIIAQYLAKGELEKGAFTPEICIQDGKFLAELARRGIKINENFQ
ncbi:MAG: saccharopine dehydrogenase C-terminal domain-containing protein [Candidatus Thermoplasmatota archaeon]|nr:saccharopine dehydrogenase C-terminal domain-containing protein [Candidatus Thermoplasmatota archaeon]